MVGCARGAINRVLLDNCDEERLALDYLPVSFRGRLHSGSEVVCTRVRSGVHGESSGADTRPPGGHVSWGSARGAAGGQAGAVRLSAGVVILVQVLGAHTSGGTCSVCGSRT